MDTLTSRVAQCHMRVHGGINYSERHTFSLLIGYPFLLACLPTCTISCKSFVRVGTCRQCVCVCVRGSGIEHRSQYTLDLRYTIASCSVCYHASICSYVPCQFISQMKWHATGFFMAFLRIWFILSAIFAGHLCFLCFLVMQALGERRLKVDNNRFTAEIF